MKLFKSTIEELKTVTIISYYSEEELTGIGKYNGEMISWLQSQGIKVVSFSNVPFYPYWKKYDGHNNIFYHKSANNLKVDIRSWVYIPKTPSSLKKVLSEFSFFITNTIAIIFNLRLVIKSDLILVVNPPFFLGFIPSIIGRLTGVQVLSHIQDLQVDAAKELKLLPVWICNLLEFTERIFLGMSNHISTISDGMIQKIEKKQLKKNILMVPNWADLISIYPIKSVSWLHEKLDISIDKKLVVYSGNIGEKQGLEVIIKAAEQLSIYSDLHFVILGEGLYKKILQLEIKNSKLKNFSLGTLVAKEDINKMLNSSFIQLVVQKSAGADSFLPSKLTNILASGTPSIITASKGTSLYRLFNRTGVSLIVEPDSVDALRSGIEELYHDEQQHKKMKKMAREWAEKNLSIEKCLSPVMDLLYP